MDATSIVVTVITSLVSGLFGVFLTFRYMSHLELRKLKSQTALKLFGAKHNSAGEKFKEAINEIMIVFADSPDVMKALEDLLKFASTPMSARSAGSGDEILIRLLKAICKEIGVKHEGVPDSHFLRFLSF